VLAADRPRVVGEVGTVVYTGVAIEVKQRR
jgi:hypothetical protein